MKEAPWQSASIPKKKSISVVVERFVEARRCLEENDVEGAAHNAIRALMLVDDNEPLRDYFLALATALEREISAQDSPHPNLDAYRAELRRTPIVRSTAKATRSKPLLIAGRLCGWGAMLAVEPARDEEWKEALLALAADSERGQALHYAAGIFYAGLHSRVSWWARCAAIPCVSYLCWVLRSQVRTWVPLLGLLLWGGLETADDTGPGTAVVFVILSGVGFFGLVEWLRKRWNVQVRRRSEKPEE
ncbi:hypothetical protein [Nonomuraea jabiensis]|uniref:hypothetical protein n=1 Tax=Nonomuraea jabiensis TaxID=882448 RepID=UPI003D703B0C